MSHVSLKYPNARVAASSVQRDWPGLRAERLEHPVGSIPSFQNVMTELTIVLAGCASVLRQLDGARPQTMDVMPGDIWLTPAGTREDFIGFEGAIPEALHIYLTPDRFAFGRTSAKQRATAISALQRDAPFRDPLVEEIGRAISAELEAPTDRSSSLLIAPLGLCLAARLLHAHTDGSREPTPLRNATGLDKLRFTNVTQHVAAHLEHHLSVSDLANVAFLSPSRFAHAFKISTGESPQHYVSARRLDRARALLSDGNLPLAEIARRSGFSSQASFTKAFLRATSQTPGRYRRQFAD